MGIRGVLKFVEQNPDNYRTVNIIEELERYTRKNSAQPVIIINLWTFANYYHTNLKDKLYGCRLNEVRDEFDTFLSRLKKNGAKLIFIFKKSRTREKDFYSSINRYFREGSEYLNAVDALRSTDRIVGHFQNRSVHKFPVPLSIMMTFIQSAKKFGELHGVDRGRFKPSTIHVQLANQNNAMALMGTDTHYIFYEGNWKFWSDAHLNMTDMTVREYDKDHILRVLGITFEKAALFATLAGGLYSTQNISRHVEKFFGRRDENFFNRIVDFVNNQSFPVTDESLYSIVMSIFTRENPRAFNDFRRFMTMITPVADLKFYSNEKIIESSERDYMNFANLILYNKDIFISPTYLRIEDARLLESIVTPWIQKTAGILLKNKPGSKISLLVVENPRGRPVTRTPETIIPDFETPSWDDIESKNIDDYKASQILKWLTNFDVSKNIYDKIPEENLCDVIILTHIVKALPKNRNSILKRAQLIMQTNTEVKNGQVPNPIIYSESIDGEALRISFFYSKLFYFLHSCLASVGLDRRYQTDFRFDNVHYQKLFENSSPITDMIQENPDTDFIVRHILNEENA